MILSPNKKQKKESIIQNLELAPLSLPYSRVATNPKSQGHFGLDIINFLLPSTFNKHSYKNCHFIVSIN